MNSEIFNNKTGDTQIDAIISIALFVVYIVVIFFFITPSLKSEANTNQETRIIEKNLENLYEKVSKLTLYVISNISEKEPLILDFPLNWNPDNIIILNNKGEYVDFYIDGRRVLLEYNLSPKNLLYIIYSNYNFSSQSRSSERITGNENYTTAQKIRVEFLDFLIKNMTFENSALILDFNIVLNNAPFEKANAKFLNSGFVNIYKLSSPELKNSIYIFNDKERIYSFFENTNTENQSSRNTLYNLVLIFNITNFTNFYSDNSNNGIINYSYKDCFSFESDYVDFYDSKNGLSFILNKISNISFCSNNNSVVLNISSTVEDLFSYIIVAHNISYSTSQLKNFYSYAYGFVKEISGIYHDYLENNSFVNSAISRNLNPSKKFRVVVKTKGRVFYYGNETSENINVYAKTISKPILYHNGSYEYGVISISTW